ncbi:MAG: hypothetical protein PHH00_03775 [Candidatus Nanoarchaeia archaeon]|nr:hypothetical protein [Candidatus Nanoarchaeia archaeon]
MRWLFGTSTYDFGEAVVVSDGYLKFRVDGRRTYNLQPIGVVLDYQIRGGKNVKVELAGKEESVRRMEQILLAAAHDFRQGSFSQNSRQNAAKPQKKQRPIVA